MPGKTNGVQLDLDNITLTKLLKGTINYVSNGASLVKPGIFGYCNRLSYANFPNCISIGKQAFYNCNNLKSISFPECIYIGENAFEGCRSLTEINFPKVTHLSEGTFYNCPSLSIARFPLVESIKADCFRSNYWLNSIYIPLCTYIPPRCFTDCTRLTEITSPNVSYIGESAFYNCMQFENLSFFNCFHVGTCAFARTGISYFSDNLFPSQTFIDYGWNWQNFFEGCSKLKEVYLHNLSSECLSSVWFGMFQRCYMLSKVTLPSTCTYLGNYAFTACSALKDVCFNDILHIQKSAFSWCYNLQTASFKNCIDISGDAFNDCKNLKKIIFPNLSNINLDVTWGQSPYKASTSIFLSCTNLEYLYFLGSTVISFSYNSSYELDSISNIFKFTPIQDSSYLGYYGSIYVRASLLSNYQNDSIWVNFSNRFIGLNTEEIDQLLNEDV